MFKECFFESCNHKDGFLRYYKYEKTSKTPQPLILYIHGAGSRGNELSQMSMVGPLGELLKGRDIPAVVLAPQCYKNTWFDLFSVLEEFIEYAINNENIDKQRVYICGISMGGYAAWQMAMSHPDWFAALVPVCGGGMYWNAERLKNIPIWAFHGALDNVVLPEESIHMVKAVKLNGGKARITIYPDKEHNAWDSAFGDDNMWKWMFSQIKTDNKMNETKIITGD